ncbi:hypothetical protein TI39_contig337g00024 [Zymoseptoria brevis]|uniref:Uncharacterized protein n=1 Tax=Zymoseptoria brevis TaxID=1047168 RepID=A0A0F4GS70_9PEZI|nr:hypothetical protein TI39_contig337g00024 [Zymoseptoria brevis]
MSTTTTTTRTMTREQAYDDINRLLALPNIPYDMTLWYKDHEEFLGMIFSTLTASIFESIKDFAADKRWTRHNVLPVVDDMYRSRPMMGYFMVELLLAHNLLHDAYSKQPTLESTCSTTATNMSNNTGTAGPLTEEQAKADLHVLLSLPTLPTLNSWYDYYKKFYWVLLHETFQVALAGQEPAAAAERLIGLMRLKEEGDESKKKYLLDAIWVAHRAKTDVPGADPFRPRES